MTLASFKLFPEHDSPDLRLTSTAPSLEHTHQEMWKALTQLAALTFPMMSVSPDGQTIIGEEYAGQGRARSLVLMKRENRTFEISPLNCESVLRSLAQTYGVSLAGEFTSREVTIHGSTAFMQASSHAQPTAELALALTLGRLLRSGTGPATPNVLQQMQDKPSGDTADWEHLGNVMSSRPDLFHLQESGGVQRLYHLSPTGGTWVLAARRTSDGASAVATSGTLRALRDILLQHTPNAPASNQLSYAFVTASPEKHLWIWRDHQTHALSSQTIWHPLATFVTQLSGAPR